MSIARRNRAAASAESRRCPACDRKSALTTVVNPGTVSRLCRWCGYESTTITGDVCNCSAHDEGECGCGNYGAAVATIRRVPRPRGELSPARLTRIASAASARDDAEAEYREEVLAAMTYDGASFSEVSKATGLSTNTLQRWKREAAS